MFGFIKVLLFGLGDGSKTGDKVFFRFCLLKLLEKSSIFSLFD